MGYSRLLRNGSDEQLIDFVETHIELGDARVMSSAIQLPHESDIEFLGRVNEGRRLQGFTATTLEELKSKRVSRQLFGPNA